MRLAERFHTVGDTKRWVVGYHYDPCALDDEIRAFPLLDRGVTIASVTVTENSDTLAVTSVAHTAGKVFFFTQGGLLNEVVTISIQVVDTQSGVRNDTIEVTVVAP